MNVTRKAEIVRTIVMLANNLGIEAIAEGLETVEQMAPAQEDCNAKYGQGDFFSSL